MLTLLVYGRLMGMVITMMEMDYSHQSVSAIPTQIMGLPDTKLHLGQPLRSLVFEYS